MQNEEHNEDSNFQEAPLDQVKHEAHETNDAYWHSKHDDYLDNPEPMDLCTRIYFTIFYCALLALIAFVWQKCFWSAAHESQQLYQQAIRDVDNELNLMRNGN